MRRLLAVFLCLVITLCCLPFPALAAADTGFSDVKADDWFAPYVAVCVEEGLMQGTGDGRFDPQRELSLAELIVLTARFYSQTMEEDIPADPFGSLDTLLEVFEGESDVPCADFSDVVAFGLFADLAVLDALGKLPESEWYSDEWLAFRFPEGQVTFGTSRDYGYSYNLRLWLWPFFMDPEEPSPRSLDDFGSITADDPVFLFDTKYSLYGIYPGLKFADRLMADPTPYSWYLNEVCYLSDQRFPHLDELQQTLRYQEGTAANTLATRGDFGALMGDLLPSPIVLHAPEDLSDIDSSGVLTLIGAGVMEGTGEGYALDKSLTRAECAAMLARMMRPELRKGATVDAHHPEELIGLEVRHSSFGQTECKYTFDFEEKTFTAWYSGYFQDAEDREETTALTDEALAGFWQSQAPAALLRWGEVYYNINIMDGHQRGVTLTFSDGETREISGSNAYPEGWDLVYDALLELTGHNIMALRSNWLDH